MSILYGLSGHVRAQSENKQIHFDVASIKLNRNPEPEGNTEISPGRFRGTGLALQWLILTAYRIKSSNLSGNLPNWTISERYDVEAKTAGPASEDQILVALQALLRDRFKLQQHSEMRDEPVYFLTVAKGGIKMPEGVCTPKKQDLPNECYSSRREGNTQLLDWRGVLMSDAKGVAYRSLSWALAGPLRRTVVDNTGLTGTYDVHLRWEREPDATTGNSIADGAAPAPFAVQNAPSLPGALREQLGLQVESGRGPVEYMIVDHVERPDAN